MVTVKSSAPSEDPQDRGGVATARAAAAASTGDHEQTLHHALEALHVGEALSLRSDIVRWAWPMAADAAFALGDTAEVAQLLETLERHRPGHVPTVLRAERLRIRARMSAAADDPAATESFEAATQAFRDLGSPYHLAVGLLDHAEHLVASADRTTAGQLATEAGTIADALRARPVVGRARDLRSSIDAAFADNPA